MSKKSGQDLVSELLELVKNSDAETVIDAVLDRVGSGIAMATSLGAEDQVLLHMMQNRLLAKGLPLDYVHVFTLDTGRLPEETYRLFERNRVFFSVPIHPYAPDAQEVEALVSRQGPNGFYHSVDNRKACCAVRKVKPLKRAIEGRTAWVVGLRRSQSPTRGNLDAIEWDDANELIKISPLLEWSGQEIWRYIREHNLPYNELHDKGYPSIGCAPCTRAVGPEEDERAGRWWWEQPEHKECGLHVHEQTEPGAARFSFQKVEIHTHGSS